MLSEVSTTMPFDDDNISNLRTGKLSRRTRSDSVGSYSSCSICGGGGRADDFLDFEVKEKLLDRFPFDEEELRRMLEAYDVYKFLMRDDDDIGDSDGGTRQAGSRTDGKSSGDNEDEGRLILHSLASFLSDGNGSAPSSSSSMSSCSSSSSSEADDERPATLATLSLTRTDGAEALLASRAQKGESTASTTISGPRSMSRSDLIHCVERSLLPRGFGPRLLGAIVSTAFVLSNPLDCQGMDEARREIWKELSLFLEGVANASGRRGPRQSLQLIFECCARQTHGVRGTKKEADATELVGLCYRLALAGHALRRCGQSGELNAALQMIETRSTSPRSMKKSLLQFTAEAMCQDPASYSGPIPMKCFVDWADSHAPQLHAVLGTFVRSILLPKRGSSSDSRNGMGIFKFPELVVCDERGETERRCASSVWHSDDDSNVNLGPEAFAMAAMGSAFCGKWRRLYTTESDGASYLSLRRSLEGYSGPTVMLIRPRPSSLIEENSQSQPSLFGLYTANPWRESSGDFYGSDDCALFRVEPSLKVYRPLGGGGDGPKSSSNYVQMNSSSASGTSPAHRRSGSGVNNRGGGSIGSSGNAGYGLGAGGTRDRPRFFVTESFEGCHADAGALDGTYEQGPLLPGEWDFRFDVDVLEAWAVGTDEAGYRAGCESRAVRQSLDESARRRSAHVDRRHFLEDFQNGTVINSLYEHREAARGRHDFSVDEDRPGNYVVKEGCCC